MQAIAAHPSQQTFAACSVERPSLPLDGAIIRTTGCGLCGTDVEKLQQHKVPDGSILGHEVVGIIDQLGPHAPAPLQSGQRVVSAHHVPCQTCHFCLNGSPSMCATFKATNIHPGGFAQYYALSGAHLQHTTFAIPSHISDREAACVEPLACVIRAIDRLPSIQATGNTQPSAAIIGLGFIGLLASQTFHLAGYSTLGVDTFAPRLSLAQTAHYADLLWQPTGDDTPKTNFLTQHTATGHADVVCLTVGNEAAWQTALSLVRNGGTILLLASSQTTPPNLANKLYYREVSVIPSYSPSLQSLQTAAQWVFERNVRLNPLITHPMPWTHINEGLTAYLNREAIKVFLTPPHAEA